ncbi:class I SAM-dependent methyltransferase [Haliea sp. E17]|uniref:class I SAM-dependent methyltransferase n=1 Tax=Haliea sp. E17 TaxID=3401576 RepID=UPI003AAC46FF
MTEQFSEISAALETWYRGERGAYLLSRLQASLDARLDTAFGYHILQTGPVQCGPLFGECRIHHRIRASEQGGTDIGLVCAGDELPLESDSVDVIIAHHALEFSPNPHQVLRELHRVLTPQGQLFLTGWNPYSGSGLLQRLRALAPRSPWREQSPVSVRRLTDWLNLLGCEVESTSYHYHLAPAGQGRLRAALEGLNDWCAQVGLPMGGIYLVHAIKQVGASQRPRLARRRERFIGLGVTSPVSSPGATTGLTQAGKTASRKKSGPVLH